MYYDVSYIKIVLDFISMILGKLPRGKLPSNPKANPNPNHNPNPNQRAIFLGGNCPDTYFHTSCHIKVKCVELLFFIIFLFFCSLGKTKINLDMSEINDTHRKKLCFTQVSTRMAASDLFYVFTQSIRLHTFYYHILKSIDV